jgi:hypothetical protein
MLGEGEPIVQYRRVKGTPEAEELIKQVKETKSDSYYCREVDERVAYPVSQEQESQAVSEVAEFLELWDMATTMHRREFMNEAKKQYTITKNK